jgi:hypothetical protein
VKRGNRVARGAHFGVRSRAGGAVGRPEAAVPAATADQSYSACQELAGKWLPGNELAETLKSCDSTTLSVDASPAQQTISSCPSRQ